MSTIVTRGWAESATGDVSLTFGTFQTITGGGSGRQESLFRHADRPPADRRALGRGLPRGAGLAVPRPSDWNFPPDRLRGGARGGRPARRRRPLAAGGGGLGGDHGLPAPSVGPRLQD